MGKIATVLVPFDFSEASKKALDYAVDFIGKDKSMKIVLAYVSDDQDSDMQGENFDVMVKEYDLKGN